MTENNEIKLNIGVWDHGGQDRFGFMLDSYIREAFTLYIFDGTRINASKEHFENFNQYLIEKNLREKTYFLASKSDHDNFSSDEIDGIESVLKTGGWMPNQDSIIKYSSKTGENIELVSNLIKQEILKNYSENSDILNQYKKSGFTINMLGVGSCGKTTLVSRLQTGEFNQDTCLTVGPEFSVYSITIDLSDLANNNIIENNEQIIAQETIQKNETGIVKKLNYVSLDSLWKKTEELNNENNSNDNE